MIGKLKGIVDAELADSVIVDVGGVGYKVHCSGRALASFGAGEAVELYIETHVREDHIHLYGFRTPQEQKTFITLQSVKGVGTRMALAILSELSPEQTQLALTSQDKTAFNNVSGVGKKLAERIITELKDKFIADIGIAAGVAGSDSSGAGAAVQGGAASDAISALVNLGINRSDAYQRISAILAREPGAGIDELIKQALKG